jgi:hypothetical protein
MRARAAQVGEDVLIVAARFFQGIGKDCDPLQVEVAARQMAFLIDRISQLSNEAVTPVEPGGQGEIDAERVAKNVAQEIRLSRLYLKAFLARIEWPRCLGHLDCYMGNTRPASHIRPIRSTGGNGSAGGIGWVLPVRRQPGGLTSCLQLLSRCISICKSFSHLNGIPTPFVAEVRPKSARAGTSEQTPLTFARLAPQKDQHLMRISAG